MYDKNKVHYIVSTAIIVKEGKYLIAKRADWEKAFPGKWTVPGGKLEVLEYALGERDTKHHWYNVCENSLKREVKEEVNLNIENIGYVTSMIFIRPDNIPCLTLSFYAYQEAEQEIKLCNALTEYAWVSLEEAKNYDLIEGIYDELVMLDKLLKGEKEEWKKIRP